MTQDSIWAELGISPTTDATAIRKAYATRLRTVQAASDDAAFARLRQAYEQARAATSPAAPPAAAAVHEHESAPEFASRETPEPSFAEQATAIVTPWKPRLRPLADDSERLSADILATVARLDLALREWVEHELAMAIALEPRVSADAVADIARALHWDDEVGLDRRGGVFATPDFRYRLYDSLAQQEATAHSPRAPLSLWNSIRLAAVFMLPTWIACRLLRHASGSALVERWLADAHVFYLWLTVVAILIVRRLSRRRH